MKYKKGFTLLELLVVVAIIGILAATSIPRLGYNIQKSKDAKVLSFLSNLRSSSVAFESDNLGDKANKIKDLAIYFDKSYESDVIDGIISGVTTSYQMKAGIVKKGISESVGRANFSNIKNIAEIYYSSSTGGIWIDATTGSGVDFLDTKENKWNQY